VLTGRGLAVFAAVAAVCVAGAVAGAPGWAFVVGNALAVGVVAADWAGASPGRIVVTRDAGGPFSIGRRNDVTLRIRNDGPGAVRLVVADGAPAGCTLHPERHVAEVGVGEEREVVAGLTPARRGPVRFPAAEIRVAGPLGLAFRERSMPATATTAVTWPDVMQLRDERLLPPGRRSGGARAVRAEAAGREFESLREYVRGDEYRRISWKATARRGRPVVAVQQPERRQTLVIALECGRLMHGAGGGELGKLDRSINAAVMLAAVAREYDDAVGVLAFAATPVRALVPAARHGQLRRMVESVADLEPALVEPGWAAGLHAVARMTRRRAVVVVFSDALYAQTDDRLAGRLGALARRHLVVFASVRDAEVTELAERPVTDAASLFERGVAVDMLEQRDLALGRLRGGGVRTLDAGPETLTRAVVGRFRELRASGSL
jgi:uncharacterized protein (DUF58 family)